jgi:hypothetical protein
MRRTKHRRRFHTGRVISNRRRRGRTLEKNDWWWREHPPENGRLRDRLYFRGCGLPRCGLCHPHKRWGGDRTREKRAWKREVAEQLA